MEDWITIKDAVWAAMLIGSFIVKNALSKNTIKNSIDQLKTSIDQLTIDIKEEEKTNNDQEDKITRNREKIINIESKIDSINEKITDISLFQREELKIYQKKTDENTQAITKLEATLNHLINWLKNNSKNG